MFSLSGWMVKGRGGDVAQGYGYSEEISEISYTLVLGLGLRGPWAFVLANQIRK